MYEKILNSTFEEYFLNDEDGKNIWRSTCGCSSISSIEKAFDPSEIKRIVDSLVMSKYNKQLGKFSSHRRRLLSRSEKKSPIKSHSDISISTCNLSELISYERHSLSTSNSRDRRLHYNHALFEEDESQLRSRETSANAHLIAALKCAKEDYVVLQQTKEQILKFIHYDNMINGGRFSRARLEAEKILLLTDIKMNEVGEETTNELFCSGTVKIARIRLWPRANKCFDQYVVCLIIYGKTVYASKISRMKSNGTVVFNEEFVLSSLPPDFHITVRFYSIASKNFKKSSKLITCGFGPSDAHPPEPLFSPWGEATIAPDDLNKPHVHRELTSGLLTTTVTGLADVSIAVSGFVNVSLREAGGHLLWNKQWACLEGKFLRYFNYPPPDPADKSELAGLVVNLASCRVLKTAVREECPRKYTLCLQVDGGKRIFMSCADKYEFLYWEDCLKTVISQINIWEGSGV